MIKTFAHHVPTPETTIKIQMIRRGFSDLYDLIEELNEKPNRELSITYTKLEEAAMWAIKGVILNDPESKVEEDKSYPPSENPEMDRKADSLGLYHWRCREGGNEIWVRADGKECEPFNLAGRWDKGLREFDKLYPMQAKSHMERKEEKKNETA